MRIVILLLCISLSGCGTIHERMVKLKDSNKNTITVPFNGTTQDAKIAIRRIGFELKLIEPKAAETEDFMVLRSNKLKDSMMVAFFGPIGGSMAAQQTNLGFMLDYDKRKNITNITISEEGGDRRDSIADKLRLISLESLALAKK